MKYELGVGSIVDGLIDIGVKVILFVYRYCMVIDGYRPIDCYLHHSFAFVFNLLSVLYVC